MTNTSHPPRIGAAYVATKSGMGTRRLFWDREGRDMDPCSRQLTGEERLWASILILAIQDYKGVHANADEECLDCHNLTHPDCFKVWERDGEPYVLRANRLCTDFHSIRECARRWIFSDAEQPRLKTNRGWIEADGYTFNHLCESLGIAPNYLRKSLDRKDFESYWADEAKINRFLNIGHSGCDLMPIDPHPSGDAGCTDSPGDTD